MIGAGRPGRAAKRPLWTTFQEQCELRLLVRPGMAIVGHPVTTYTDRDSLSRRV